MPNQPSLFAQIVAHDLRSPIAAASEALALSETVGPVRAERLRGIAHENLRRAERMVSGLRNFVRAEGASLAAKEIDVRKLLAGMVREIEEEAAGNSVTICIVGDLGLVRGSEAHMSHVFRNLIANAVVHNANMDGLVVKVGRVDSEDAVFYVNDNGRGIPPREHQRIFEPFRGDRKEVGKGMGLGLSLVRSLVDQLNGKVWVESNSGSGVTFWFSCPGHRCRGSG